MGAAATVNPGVSPTLAPRCGLCGVLHGDEPRSQKARALGTCDACADRPEAPRPAGRAPLVGIASGSRAFTVADRSLIRKVHAFMPAQQLLELLNERLRADLPKARPYTLAQLHDELALYAGAAEPAGDWAGLRKLLAAARRAGTLACVTTELVDDFAIVFALSPAQVMRLKETVVGAAHEARSGVGA